MKVVDVVESDTSDEAETSDEVDGSSAFEAPAHPAATIPTTTNGINRSAHKVITRIALPIDT
jgi:hypothetical protein